MLKLFMKIGSIGALVLVVIALLGVLGFAMLGTIVHQSVNLFSPEYALWLLGYGMDIDNAPDIPMLTYIWKASGLGALSFIIAVIAYTITKNIKLWIISNVSMMRDSVGMVLNRKHNRRQ